jgi:hypothetical protein
LENSPHRQASNQPQTPPNLADVFATHIKKTHHTTKPIGTAALHDHTGKEVNLDGTPKMPYRHPHFGHVTTVLPHNTHLDGQHAPPLPNV